MIRITLSSVLVNDQEAAARFYTEKLGFVKKNDIPMGEFRWLTVVAADGVSDVELLLEPNNNPASKTFQAAIYEQGIPITSFAVDDLQAEYDRLTNLGVVFRGEPTEAPGVKIALLEDTCGNLISLHQVVA